MSLTNYFQRIIDKVETNTLISNAGKDTEGFYKPTKTILLRHLSILKDLHEKPLAKPMLRISWKYVTEEVPPEWLILDDYEKAALKKMLEP